MDHRQKLFMAGYQAGLEDAAKRLEADLRARADYVGANPTPAGAAVHAHDAYVAHLESEVGRLDAQCFLRNCNRQDERVTGQRVGAERTTINGVPV